MFDPQTLEEVARELEARGDIAEAIAAYQKIVAIDPRLGDALTPQIDKLSARLEPKAPDRAVAPATPATAKDRAGAAAATSKTRQAQSLQQGDAGKRGNP